AFIIEGPTLVGAYFGAYLSSKLEVHALEYIFALFIFLLSLKMFFLKKTELQDQADAYRVGLGAACFFGGLSGILAGLFGIGGGFLKTPVMIKVFKMPPKVAVGTALFMIIFTSLISSITHIGLGHMQWGIALPILS